MVDVLLKICFNPLTMAVIIILLLMNIGGEE